MSHIMQQDPEIQHRYTELVNQRKTCKLCPELINPAIVCDGLYDRNHIGPWSCWQGNLASPIVVIGQDWGNPEVFERSKGLEPFCSENDRGTNGVLVDLLGSIGIRIERPKGHETIGKLFFTNAIMCLKQGNLQAPVKKEWFELCGRAFIKPLIEVINPLVVISLGEMAYRALENTFSLNWMGFRHAVTTPTGIPLNGHTRLFPMYHCCRRILNTHRNIEEQKSDWARVGAYLRQHGPNVC